MELGGIGWRMRYPQHSHHACSRLVREHCGTSQSVACTGQSRAVAAASGTAVARWPGGITNRLRWDESTRSSSRHRWLTGLVPGASPATRCRHSSRKSLMQELLWGPDRLQTVMSIRASQVPPQLFFWLLMLAGCGVPISEDILCIYAGAILKELSSRRRVEVVVALYLGVVLSDWWTYSLGRFAGKTFLKVTRASKEPRMSRLPGRKGKKRKLSKLERAQALFVKSGSSVGFASRLAPGLRVPLLLLSGLSKVKFWRKFVPYNLLGAAASLAMQLLIGIVGRASPALLQAGHLALILPCFGAAVIGVVIFASIRRSRAKEVPEANPSEAA